MSGWFASLIEPSAASLVGKINALEADIKRLSDHELAALTADFRVRLEKGEPIKSLIPETFATVREAAWRKLGMRHFDAQIRGGVELARGHVIEMKTGEGKTLVATLPAYLHALEQKGVHVVTVNDYLAKRDADWMGQIYRFLGLTVDCIQENMGDDYAGENRRRKAAYAADITYGTNHEVVFDFLRDNLAHDPQEIVQRGQHYAIVDEVDLLLIDEAQTPLIISGRGEEDTGLFVRVDALIRKLRQKEDFEAERRTKSASLTEIGLSKIEQALGIGSLSDPANLSYMHAVHQSLQAHAIFERDVDYIVDSGEVHIIDEHTGRVSPDKRFSDGLHQALEAKERVRVKTEDTTLAKTSYQHFFRAYWGLCGMTGTATSEREEFRKIYKKKVVRIPTHKPMIRKDYERIIFASMADKHRAVVEEIRDAHENGQPVLVGTVSVLESEQISRLLAKEGIKHEILNAKHHKREAEIIAQAGREGAVTISTNMAGRGTDILLGGNPEKLAEQKHEPGTEGFSEELERLKAQCEQARVRVIEAGGLYVIGTGEHESVRIDNQLRGRAGRQGDPGSSLFFVSVQDPVYRMFGEKEVIERISEHLADHPAGEPVEDRVVSQALTGLRKKVEVENQSIRLDVFKYDLVINDNRQQIWAWRRQLLDATDAGDWREQVAALIEDLVEQLEGELTSKPDPETDTSRGNRELWVAMLRRVLGQEPHGLPVAARLDKEEVSEWLLTRYDARFGSEMDEMVREWERFSLLMTIDRLWPQFLTDIERVEEGIGLRGYSQLDPLNEFRREAGMLFGHFLMDVRVNAVRAWMTADVHAVSKAVMRAEPSDAALALRPKGGEQSPRRKRAIDSLPSIRRGRGRKRKA
jgi:preprotein translocase subunit SecA